jgi:hypothetical protein
MGASETWLVFSDDTVNFISDANQLNPQLLKFLTPSKNIILSAEFKRINNDAALKSITSAGYGAGYSAAINNYLTNGSSSWKIPSTMYSGSDAQIAHSIIGTSANPGTLLYPDAEAQGFSNDIYLTPDFEYDCVGPNKAGADGFYGYLQTLLTSWALRVLNPNNAIVPVIGQNVASGNTGTYNGSSLQAAAQKILPANVLDDFNFNAKTFPELLYTSKVNGQTLVDSLSVENYAQNKNKSTATAPAGNPGFPVANVPYSVVTDFANSDKTTYQTALPSTSNYSPAKTQQSLNLPDGSIYIGDKSFQWNTLTNAAINNISIQSSSQLENQAQNLIPEVWLMHYGMPNGLVITEDIFKALCNDLVEFVSNSGIKKLFFEIGDYKSIQQYNYCNPTNYAAGTKSSWLVTYLLNKLPSQVEVGAVASMTPEYPWQIDKNNTANNTNIGDGSIGNPKDNARQAFELIQTINQQSSIKQITSFHIDHEGGGAYQNDTTYGGTNGQPIGVGYLKWLWNHFMPSSATIFTDTQATQSSFRGHYDFGWINYGTTAWQANSYGSIDAYSENYWFGENEDYPGKYSLDPSLSANLTLAERLGLDLQSFQDVFGTDPTKYPTPIQGGANIINWYRTIDPTTKQPSSAPNAVPTLNENAILSVYRMYKDNPTALANMFNDQGFSSLSTLKVAPFNNIFYAPLDTTKNNNNPGSPQGGIPTVSLENLSASNQSQQAVINAGLANTPYSLTSQFTYKNDALNPNSTGGSFDGLSALDYNDFITFLNTSAGILSTAGITPGQPGRDPTSARIALYELQFIPMNWVNQQVANNHPYLIRFHDPITGRHHYTHNLTEANTLVAQGWKREGRSLSLLNNDNTQTQLKDVWRLFQPSTGDHLLTTSEAEQNHAKQLGYVLEGKIGAVSSTPSNGLRPIYRFYNSEKHQHFYTADLSEASSLTNTHKAEGHLGWV